MDNVGKDKTPLCVGEEGWSGSDRDERVSGADAKGCAQPKKNYDMNLTTQIGEKKLSN